MRAKPTVDQAKIKRAKPYRVKQTSLGGIVPGVNLDKALALADALEDQELAAQMKRCEES